MLTSAEEMRALRQAAELEPPLAAVETCLADLASALCRNDAVAVEEHAAVLHRTLATAVAHFTRAAREGGVPPQLRHRLALAGSQVAAQREALARATASLDRAIDVLLPEHPQHPVYGPTGAATRQVRSGALQA